MALPLVFTRHDYEYDIYSLIRAFFPKLELAIRYAEPGDPAGTATGEEYGFFMAYTARGASFAWDMPDTADMRDLRGAAETGIDDWSDRTRTKDQLKQLVYRTLRLQTGRELPWGALTGIRPVKLVRRMLDAGKSEADILSFMRENYFTSGEKASLALDIARRELDLTKDLDLARGYSLYVGIPFCPSICLYCSFGSHPLERFSGDVEDYLSALDRELAFLAEKMRGETLTAVYIGGGTPTSVTAAQLDRLLARLDSRFAGQKPLEFTVEAGRPDTVTEEKLRVLLAHGVSRISINPQTMVQRTLDLIGRKHTAAQTEEAFALARRLGFDNINMDLIVGLPGEGEEEIAYTLSKVRELSPDSLTIHSLALKRAARLSLFREEFEDISFENSSRIMEMAAQTAGGMGMRPYYLYRQKNMAGNFENVGYARPGKECLYNILIMEELQTIIGAGSGASTKFVFDRGKATSRAESVKNIRDYIDRTDEMLERKRVGIVDYYQRRG